MTEFIRSLEELDIALFEKFSGVMIEGKVIAPTYYTPDVDLVELEAPAIVLYRTNPYRDLTRWNNNEEFSDNPVYDGEGNLTGIDSRLSPEPWSIAYTVKTLYEYQEDGVKLNDFMLRLFPRGSYITINNVDYAVEALSAGLWGSQYKDFGKTEDGKRRFQETYAFRVDFYLEVDNRRPQKIVREVVIENRT